MAPGAMNSLERDRTAAVRGGSEGRTVMREHQVENTAAAVTVGPSSPSEMRENTEVWTERTTGMREEGMKIAEPGAGKLGRKNIELLSFEVRV